MDRDEVWRMIDAQRLSLADLLEQLTPEEWEQPSLCDGWTVRDVAAHLALSHTGALSVMVGLLQARGRFNRMIHDSALRHAARPVGELVAQLRGMAGSRRHAPGTTYLGQLLDVLVHSQDIALPLGRQHEMPPSAAAVAATRAWTTGFPFHARKKLRGLRLTATDVSWSVGQGMSIEGPMDPILLLLTGRTVALARLSGEGVPKLTAQLSAQRSSDDGADRSSQA